MIEFENETTNIHKYAHMELGPYSRVKKIKENYLDILNSWVLKYSSHNTGQDVGEM